MKAWTTLYDYLMPLAPGCSQAMADLQLRIAAQEWCDKTLCWRVWLDDVTTEADVNQYDFETGIGQDVVQLLRATLDGHDLEVITVDTVPANWRSDTSFSEHKGIFSVDSETFILVPMPDVGLIVQTEVALRPTNDATGIEDFIFNSYASDIATGAAARLHAMPKKPYSYPQSTARAQFQAAIDSTASDVWHAFSRAPARTRASFL